MGSDCHHAILVTAHDVKVAVELHLKIAQVLAGSQQELLYILSSLHVSPINRRVSFTIYPDGSEEGRSLSNEGDEIRNKLVTLLRNTIRIDWVEVQYGHYKGESKIVNHSDDPESVKCKNKKWVSEYQKECGC